MSAQNLLDRFLGSPLGEMLSGSAFRACPTDVCATLGQRFPGKSLLLLMSAREKAAVLRVGFDGKGEAQVRGGRQLQARQVGELSRVLEVEARESGAAWVLAVISQGWQAEIGRRAAGSPEDESPFERHRICAEQPELLVAQAKPDRIYAAVDHPTLDRSIVFSCKRRELEALVQDIEAAGLGVAGIRLGVASQLGCWLGSQSEQLLNKDILVSDGMSVLLLNLNEGDFSAPGNQAEAMPRQASSRPNDAAQDTARFVRDNEGRDLVFLGPPEFAAIAAEPTGPVRDAVRPEDPRLHDPALAALCGNVLHDFNPRIQRQRAPLPVLWRKIILSYAVLLGLLLYATAALCWNALENEGLAVRAFSAISDAHQRRDNTVRLDKDREKEKARALELREWLTAGYHAQAFAYRLLSSLHEGVVLDQMSARLDEGSPQLSLGFSLRGSEEARVASLRSLEQGVIEMGYRIGERRGGGVGSSSGHSHRWRLLLPAWKGDSRP